MDNERQNQKEMLGAIVNAYGLSKEQVIDLVEDLFATKEKGYEPIKVGWYAFAGGKFSAKPRAYAALLGVVAWLNPDPNAPIGKRGLILVPDSKKECWSDEYFETGICDEEDGQRNTRNLIAYGKQFFESDCTAAEWCYSYAAIGVTPGEGFLPAKKQLERIIANKEAINEALAKIFSSPLKGWNWSSSEYSYYSACVMCVENGAVCAASKTEHDIYIRCVIAF